MNALADFRQRVVDALTPICTTNEWELLPTPVDAMTPPAFMLSWADPWLQPGTFCDSFAQLDVIAVAARLEPEPNIEILEDMVASALGALTGFGFVQVGPPSPFETAQITYLAARLLLRQPIGFAT